MTFHDAGDLVKRILGAYPGDRRFMSREDIGAMTASYTAGLIDLDFGIACVAVDRASKTCERIPTIARIRAEVGEMMFGQRRSGAEAWEDVMDEVRRVGHCGTPVWRDPVVAQASRAVGWRTLCAMAETDQGPRAKFCDAYNRIATGERKQAQISNGAGANRSGLRLGRSERVGGELDIGSLATLLLQEGDSDA